MCIRDRLPKVKSDCTARDSELSRSVRKALDGVSQNFRFRFLAGGLYASRALDTKNLPAEQPQRDGAVPTARLCVNYPKARRQSSKCLDLMRVGTSKSSPLDTCPSRMVGYEQVGNVNRLEVRSFHSFQFFKNVIPPKLVGSPGKEPRPTLSLIHI